MRVADGIDTVEGLRVGNAYLVQCGTGLLLVDSGTPGSAARVLRARHVAVGPPGPPCPSGASFGPVA